MMIYDLASFSPLLLMLHCLFIFLFKKYLGPTGTFYSSTFIFMFIIFSAFNDLHCISINGHYYYVDFGRCFYCLDIIDSHFVFCIDNLSLICAILVLFLTALALYFGVEYMYREAFINRLLYLLNMFATSVIFLFFCYDFFLIIIA